MFRYAEPAYFWPIIFVAAAAMPLLERWIAPLAIGQVAAVSIVIVAIGGWFGFVPLLMHWQHPLAGCLQARRGELGLKARTSQLLAVASGDGVPAESDRELRQRYALDLRRPIRAI